jgi:hypothetical protein
VQVQEGPTWQRANFRDKRSKMTREVIIFVYGTGAASRDTRTPGWWQPISTFSRRFLELPRRRPNSEQPDPTACDPLPDQLWDAVLADPRAAGRPPLPIQQCRLSEIPRHLLRVVCLRCTPTVEIQKADAILLYGPHAVWKDVGQRLLDDGCQYRTGQHEIDGCWPNWFR